MTRRAAARLVLLGSLAACATLPGVARAQGTPVDAEELFKQGRAALEAGDYRVACDKLEASLHIERAVGTLMSLAKCEEAVNKIASAREHWQEAGDLADASYDRLKRGPACREKFAELDPRVPRLTINVVNPPPGTIVKRDGVPLVAAALNTAMPVELGAHKVEVEAPGFEPRSYDVDLLERQAKTLEVRAGAELPKPSRGMGSLFWAGAGVAGAGLVVGVVAGAVALGDKSSLKSECGMNGDCSSPSARSTYSGAVASSAASDVGFAIAGAGAGLAFVGWLTHRHGGEGAPPAASVAIGPRSLGVIGTFP
jgi:hypothetical protein